MPERTNRIGRHLPTSGGLAKTLWAARELGCETIQIFVSNPQGWADPGDAQDADDVRRRKPENSGSRRSSRTRST